MEEPAPTHGEPRLPVRGDGRTCRLGEAEVGHEGHQAIQSFLHPMDRRDKVKIYQIATSDGKTIYTEGDAEKVIQSLLSGGVKFVDVDGKRLHIIVKEVGHGAR